MYKIFKQIENVKSHFRSYQYNSFVAYEEIKKKIAAMYKPNW